MRKLKICFVYCRRGYQSGDPPLGIAYLLSFLKKNSEFSLHVIDTTFSRSLKHVYTALEDIKPDVVGIYSDSLMAPDALEVGKRAKEKNFYVVFGGPQPTVAPEYFMNSADVIVRGEGELAFSEVLKSFEKKDLSHIPGIWWKKKNETIKNTGDKKFIDVNETPFPDRDLLPMKQYIYYWNYLDSVDVRTRGTTMIVSRGCPFSCTYCQPTLNQMFGKKVRVRSPGNVVQELKMLKEKYGIEGFFFHDDTFTFDHSWMNQLCDLMEKDRLNILWGCNSRIDTVNEDILQRMYAVGLRSIHFGIESGSQRILDEIYDKKTKVERVKDTIDITRKAGIHTMGFFMIGAPTETEEEIKKTISFAASLKLDEASFSLTTPLVGTYLHDKILKDNKELIDQKVQRLNYYSHYALRGGVGGKKIKILQYKAMFRFYGHPYRLPYILKHLFTLRGIIKLTSKIKRVIGCTLAS